MKNTAQTKKKGVPRPEYPRMQFRREYAWMNLNGTWDFAIDRSGSALERGIVEKKELFDRKIVVPFCPESKLSGVEDVDFMEDVWYRREIVFPSTWAGKRIFLHFGGVDFLSEIWIDGHFAGSHSGGSSPFSVDVTALARSGRKQVLVVHAYDAVRGFMQGAGKQSLRFHSAGCLYTRVTGIWQTVWAEAVHPQGLANCRATPNFDTSEIVLEPRFLSTLPGDRLRVTVRGNGRTVAERDVPAGSGTPISLAIPNARAWSPSDPFLYDLTFEVVRGTERIDRTESYFAMRKVSCEGGRICLNGKPVFLRFVLDQGFYPNGIWTAPSDADLKADVERSLAAGFNGARLHQKVFEDRWHYWADRLGYLTWAEYPSWGFDAAAPEAQRNFFEDWQAVVTALRNHPSVIGWTPFNETTGHNGLEEVANAKPAPARPDGARFRSYQRFVRSVVAMTHALDPSRPVNDASGWTHVESDLWTVHSYRATPEEQKKWLFPKKGNRTVAANIPDAEPQWDGQPVILDEWGGFKYLLPEDRKSSPGWGYNGLNLTKEKDLLDRIGGQTALFAGLKRLAGWCYTQLTDVEQEQNGVYAYARRPKADPAKFAAVFGVKPKWSAW